MKMRKKNIERLSEKIVYLTVSCGLHSSHRLFNYPIGHYGLQEQPHNSKTLTSKHSFQYIPFHSIPFYSTHFMTLTAGVDVDEISTAGIRETLERLSLKQMKEEGVLSRTREDLKDFSFLLLERLQFEEEEKNENEIENQKLKDEVKGERGGGDEDDRKIEMHNEVNSNRKERRESSDGGIAVRAVTGEINNYDKRSSRENSTHQMSASPLQFLNVLNEEGSSKNIPIPPKGDVIARTKKLPALLFSSYGIGEEHS